MIVLRFSPRGKKRHITYKVVAIEKHRAVKGKFIEELGSYNPHTKELRLKQDRIKHWLSKGAQPSDTVKSLIEKSSGQESLLIEKRSYKKKSKKDKAKEKAEKKDGPKEKKVEESDPKEKIEETAKPEDKKKDSKKEEKKEDKPKEKKENKPVEKPKQTEQKEEKKEDK